MPEVESDQMTFQRTSPQRIIIVEVQYYALCGAAVAVGLRHNGREIGNHEQKQTHGQHTKVTSYAEGSMILKIFSEHHNSKLMRV